MHFLHRYFDVACAHNKYFFSLSSFHENKHANRANINAKSRKYFQLNSFFQELFNFLTMRACSNSLIFLLQCEICL